MTHGIRNGIQLLAAQNYSQEWDRLGRLLNTGWCEVLILVAVTLLVIAPMMLVVNPNKVPARTVRELITYLKQNPGKVTYASTGTGSVAHLSVELFKLLTGGFGEQLLRMLFDHVLSLLGIG